MVEMNEYSFCNHMLAPDEYVVHRCKPGAGHLLGSQDVFMIPFSLFWCGFAFFWEIGVIFSGAPFFFCLFGLPFICIGLYLVVGRFFHTAWLRKRTAYVITNKRILRSRNGKIDVLDGSNLPPMQLQTYSDGNGTITFGHAGYYRRFGRTRYTNGVMFSLENIPDVMRVQQYIATMEK